jgi:hypothetical protein
LVLGPARMVLTSASRMTARRGRQRSLQTSCDSNCNCARRRKRRAVVESDPDSPVRGHAFIAGAAKVGEESGEEGKQPVDEVD